MPASHVTLKTETALRTNVRCYTSAKLGPAVILQATVGTTQLQLRLSYLNARELLRELAAGLDQLEAWGESVERNSQPVTTTAEQRAELARQADPDRLAHILGGAR